MANRIDIGESGERQNRQTRIDADMPGKITETIGSGKHAQAAIVWQTIKWSFVAGSVFSLIFVLYAWLGETEVSPAEDIKMIWSIFIPVITLALGYIFGKGRE